MVKCVLNFFFAFNFFGLQLIRRNVQIKSIQVIIYFVLIIKQIEHYNYIVV